MKKALYIFPPLSALRKMAFHRRGFLRLNRIDYATGQISEKLYRFGNICFTTNKAQALYLQLSGIATGIDGISAAQQLGAAVYSLGGAQLGSARRGVNIVRYGNGDVRKVLVK